MLSWQDSGVVVSSVASYVNCDAGSVAADSERHSTSELQLDVVAEDENRHPVSPV
jgi:hypothetical protein